jgi:hypothetical protein
MGAVVMSVAPGLRSLEFVADRGMRSIIVCVGLSERASLRDSLASALPGLELTDTSAPTLQRPFAAWEACAVLTDALPLHSRSAKELAFAPALLNLLGREDTRAIFQLVVGPDPGRRWRENAINRSAQLAVPRAGVARHVLSLAIPAAAPPKIPADGWAREVEAAAQEKATKRQLRCISIRCAATSDHPESARELIHQIWVLLCGIFADGHNVLQLAPIRDVDRFADNLTNRRLGSIIVLGEEELAAIVQLPHPDAAPGELLQMVKTLPAPRAVRAGDLRIAHDVQGREVFQEVDAVRQHMLVVGATGTGKSTFMNGLFLALMQAGWCGAFIDMKGDAVRALVERVPERRVQDLRVFDPSRIRSLVLNVLALAAAEDLTEAILGLDGDSIGVRRRRLIYNGIKAIKANLDGDLTDLHRVLLDRRFREELLAHTDDPYCRSFWHDEFDELSPAVRRQWIEPALHVLEPFLGNPIVRRAISGHGLDVAELIDGGGLLLADLGQGRVGPANARVLAHIALSGLKAAALRRIDVPDAQRRDVVLLIDEAHASAPEHLIQVLSEFRALHVGLVLSTQFLHQLPPTVVEAILGNVGSIIAFRVGEPDARLLAQRFAPEFSVADLVSLSNHHAAARIVARGEIQRPFTLVTEPLPEGMGAPWAEHARDVSLRRFGSPRQTETKPNEILSPHVAAPPELEWEPA